MIPNKMHALVQHEASGKLSFEEVDVPTPASGEVLIRMESTPLNPSDLSFLQATFGEKPNYPVIPGIEGSGTVVAVGKGLLPKLRMGKRVSCSSTKGKGGTWAEYMVTSAMHVIPIGKEIDFDQAAMLIVNPLTALSFMDIAKSTKAKALVNNAAAGALGKMIIRLAKKNNIECINIVRREAQVDELKSNGVAIVLNSSDIKFREGLAKLMEQYQAKLILDPVGGPEAGVLIEAAPIDSTLILYANLSESPISIETRDIVQKEKVIKGFSLPNYNAKKSLLKALSDTKKAQKLIKNELNSIVQKKFPLDQANEALELYKNNMSAGKVLLDCKLR